MRDTLRVIDVRLANKHDKACVITNMLIAAIQITTNYSGTFHNSHILHSPNIPVQLKIKLYQCKLA